MKKILLGSRTEKPCYFDMAARFPWTDGRTNYGRGFRIGDRAGAYVRLLHWRLQNPDRRLVILDDSSFQESQHAASLSAEWMFADIADEIWKLYPEEKIQAPEGENIYDECLWFLWKDLRFFRPPLLIPKISVPSQLIENFKNDLPRQNIGNRFIVVQPLLDATYNQKRNQDPQWWNKLIGLLSDHCDVVVLGTLESNQHLGPQAHPRTRVFNSLDPMASLALMSLSSCFVGGETGLTLWAPILQIPTVGLMSKEHKGYLMDTAPLSFGAPVNCFPLEEEAHLIAHFILQFMKQHHL